MKTTHFYAACAAYESREMLYNVQQRAQAIEFIIRSQSSMCREHFGLTIYSVTTFSQFRFGRKSAFISEPVCENISLISVTKKENLNIH